MEKLVHEYLNTIVGDNPTLTISKRETHFIRGMKLSVFMNDYYVNSIKVGSRNDGVKKISMNSELYNKVKKLFGLNNTHTSQYFNNWINKFERNDR